jgi:hypothetical protein
MEGREREREAERERERERGGSHIKRPQRPRPEYQLESRPQVRWMVGINEKISSLFIVRMIAL